MAPWRRCTPVSPDSVSRPDSCSLRSRWMRIALRRILFPRFVRRPINRFARSPFGRLVGHFLARVVAPSESTSQDSASAEFEFGVGALLGLLAAPGAFQCLMLLDKYSSLLNWMRGRLHQDLLLTSQPASTQLSEGQGTQTPSLAPRAPPS